MTDRTRCADGATLSCAGAIAAAAGALATLIAAILSGCTFAEPGYDQLLATARTDCRAGEIAGVWVDRRGDPTGIGKDVSYLSTLLLRADGTGIWRLQQPGPDMKLFGGNTRQWTIRYHYAGGGLWTIDGFQCAATARISGDSLLTEYNADGIRTRRVWTRADGDASLERERARR